MIKKILTTIAVIILIIVMGYMFKDITTTNVYANDDRFIQIGIQSVGAFTLHICYDKETKIEYAFYGKYNMQVLVDTEGKPLLYKE